LNYFTANAWSNVALSHEKILDEFCQNRYRRLAAEMKKLWQKAISVSYMSDWSGNYGYIFTRADFGRPQYGPAKNAEEIDWKGRLVEACTAFEGLSKIDWNSEVVRRDTIDIARTILDRLIVYEAGCLAKDYKAWQESKREGADLPGRAHYLAQLAQAMADVLELHTDYSLWESFVRLNNIEPVRNVDFPAVLFDNASNSYCQSHQYELARYWYETRAKQWAEKISELVKANDRKSKLLIQGGESLRLELQNRKLETLRPLSKRTAGDFVLVMEKIKKLISSRSKSR
jgi:hypothetical protein